MTDVDDSPLSLAELYFVTARSFATGAHAIVKSSSRGNYANDFRFIISCEMLVGHAIEVYLKAWLAEHDDGYSKSTLSKQPFGHNLRALFEEAKSLGFSDPQDVPAKHTFNDLVESYEKPHADYSLRYPSNGWTFEVPKNDTLFAVLSRLDAAVATKLGYTVPSNLDWSVGAEEDFRSSTPSSSQIA